MGGGWLYCGSNAESKLIIEDDTSIGHYVHIVCLKSITIEKSVLIANKVFISDSTHEYKNINIPIKNQNVKVLKDVVIGEGAWIGENVCILGANIGKHSVVGSNSVVLSDIPDYTVAVGCPSKVIKKYNFDTKVWEDVK